MDLLPPLTVAIPFAVAAVLMAAPKATPRYVADVLAMTAAVCTAGLAVWMMAAYPVPLVHWFGGWEPQAGVAVGIDFFADLIGAGAAGFAALVTCAALVVSWRYFDAVGSLYHALTLILLGGLAGFCLTGDLFNLFVFYELVGVSAYALTAYKVEEAGPLQGSINFAVVMTLGASLFLVGVALLYGRTGVLNMAEMGGVLADAPVDGLVVVAFVLITGGLAIKSAILPFHFAHADAHAVAPTPVLVVFSGFFLYAGLYGIARTYWTIFAAAFSGSDEVVQLVFIYAGSATALVAGVMSLMQHHMKRLLAFISISHGGIMLAGLGVFSPSALAGVFLYIAAHGSALAALFVLVGLLLNVYDDVHDYHLHGRARRLVWPGLLFGLAALVIAGLPPFGTFIGKTMIEDAAAKAGFVWMSPIFIAATALTFAAAARAGARIFLGWGSPPDAGEEGQEEQEGQAEEPQSENGGSERQPSLVMILPAAALIALALALGLSDRTTALLHGAATSFQHPEFYRDAVLGPAPIPEAAPPRPVDLHLRKSLWKTAIALALGAVLVAGSLLSHRIPEPIRRAGSFAAKPLHIIRYWHSGHIGDYVVWMIVGIATFGATALILLT